MTGRVAIVVEGGAMRGVFTAGVLDVFLEKQFDPFDLALGVSAGACNLASHLAGQHGRNQRSYLDLMVRREFLNPWRALRGGSAMDLDWLWDALAEREPLDVQAIARRTTEFVVVATSPRTGEAVYLRPGPAEMFDALKASSAMPILYRGEVRVGGERLVDGGMADPIPVEEAYRRGARDLLVLRTRPADAVKRYDLSARATAFQLRREPGLAKAVRAMAASYQRAVAFMARPPVGCRVLQVAPQGPLATQRTTQDRSVLVRDYELGRRLGEEAMARFG
ncbi:MAG: patatin family protein [Myxococcales bacterium]